MIDRFCGLGRCLHSLIALFVARIEKRLCVEGQVSLTPAIAGRINSTGAVQGTGEVLERLLIWFDAKRQREKLICNVHTSFM